MEFSDAFPGLIYSDEYLEVIPLADGETRTSILDLPVELLFEISQYVRYSDVYSLIRVNKALHIIGIQRLYTTIPLHLRYIKFSNPGAVQDDTPFGQLLNYLRGQPPRILRRLFARQEHLDAVRTLILCGVPDYSLDVYPKLLDTLLQGIFHSCTNIQTFCIKGRTQWYWYPLQAFASLNGITFPESLSTVRLDEMSTLTQTLLARVPSLTVLELQNWEKAESLDQIPPGLSATLIELRCMWDFHRATESFEDFSRRFVTLVPNLKRLVIGYKTDDNGKDVHMSPVWYFFLFIPHILTWSFHRISWMRICSLLRISISSNTLPCSISDIKMTWRIMQTPPLLKSRHFGSLLTDSLRFNNSSFITICTTDSMARSVKQSHGRKRNWWMKKRRLGHLNLLLRVIGSTGSPCMSLPTKLREWCGSFGGKNVTSLQSTVWEVGRQDITPLALISSL